MAEQKLVELSVVGSSPITHPKSNIPNTELMSQYNLILSDIVMGLERGVGRRGSNRVPSVEEMIQNRGF